MKKISKKERNRKRREANKLISFSQMSQYEQLRCKEDVLAEI